MIEATFWLLDICLAPFAAYGVYLLIKQDHREKATSRVRPVSVMPRYFLDTEFIEDGKTIDLVSLALVCEDGRELYVQSEEADLSRASGWVKKHVISNLDKTSWYTRDEIKTKLLDFVKLPAQFWGYYADYDWVALCQIFGTMMDLPEGWPMYCNDLKQLQVAKAPDVDLHKLCQQEAEHNALWDARWNMCIYSKLTSLPHE